MGTELSLEAQLEELLSEDISSVVEREQTTFDRLTEPFSNSLVLFGAGNLGRKTLTGLRKVGIEPLAFADNNPNLWNKSINGLKVISPQDAALKYGSTAAFIITIWRGLGGDRQAQRRGQLLNLNCQKVVSFGYLFWKYPEIFLPHWCLDLPQKMYERANELRSLFYFWADEDSRRVYLAQLRFRLLLDFDGLPSPVAHKQYFPDDLFDLSSNEFFLDCGAFDGDTIREFLQHQGSSFNKIVAFEPDPQNFEKLQRYILSLVGPIREKVTCLPYAVGAHRKKIHFNASGTIGSAVSNTGNLEVDCITLDEYMGDQLPTYLKFDIEGAEIDALIGARRLVQKAQPILATCLYHQPDHLWHIPLLIKELSADSNIFLRPHDEEGWELVCYAVPSHRIKS
jgi:FkbM family methyltransferase